MEKAKLYAHTPTGDLKILDRLFSGYDKLYKQAERQSAAGRAVGYPVEWYVQDLEVVDILKKSFEGLKNITVTWKP